MHKKIKLGIGAANFGKKYGLSNFRIRKNQIKKIFNFIEKNKIDLIDTAKNYKNSEKIVGEQKKYTKKIVTKIFLKKTNDINNFLIEEIRNSLLKLNKKKIYGVLIHNIEILDVIDKEKLYQALKYLKKKRLIKKVGFSIYELRDLKYFKKQFIPDIIQVPMNIFDRRFCNKAFVDYVRSNNIEVHVRSCFLQGLLINYKNIKKFKKFKKWNNLFKKLDIFCKKKLINRMEASILFIRNNHFIKYVVIGIENVDQLKMIHAILNCQLKISNFPKNIKSNNLELIDPRKWNNV